ncbi:MAG TPA: response regulator [Candidatus Faecisoma merdavium]|nr:response regulator [Candidatus Faecisoma merdavium]
MKDVNILKNNGVNVDKSLELFGDMETYDETLETFLTEANEKINNIKKYKEIADMANYAILVHSLKSDAKYFGFDKLAELSYNHELESKANHIYYIYDHFDELMDEADRILNLVRQYLGKEIVKKEEKSIIKDKTILVVDDSEVISSFIKKLFNNEYNVLLAKDGMEAINNLNNESLVGMLLDLNMPNVNGFVVLEYMKNNDLFKTIPVSIITGVGNDDIIKKAFEYPVVDVLRKPFNERDIRKVVEKTIATI